VNSWVVQGGKAHDGTERENAKDVVVEAVDPKTGKQSARQKYREEAGGWSGTGRGSGNQNVML